MNKLITICLLILSLKVSAQEQTFVREYTYKASELDSKVSCRAIATNQLRSELLNEVGVYVKSEQLLSTKEINGKFSQDFMETIETISAGVVNLKVLEETWNGEIFWMKASVTVNRQDLQESLRKLTGDEQKVKQLQEVHQQLAETTKELNKLRVELNDKRTDQVAQAEKYSAEVNNLITTDYLLRGNMKFEKGDYQGAIEEFSKAIDGDPKNSKAYCNRGAAKAELKRYAESLADYDKAIEINSNFALAYRNKCISLNYLRDYARAIASATKAIEIDGKYADAYRSRGISKGSLGDYRGSIADLTMAIDINPEFMIAYYDRGVSKVAQRKPREAIADFDRAIALNSQHGESYYNRGLMKIASGKKRDGCRDLSKAGELGVAKSYEIMGEYCN